MKRENIKGLVDERLAAIGCPLSNRNVKIVPSRTRIEVAVGDRRMVMEFNSGLPECEVRSKIADFERRYLDCKNQVDLEEAIGDVLAAGE
jgi:hypothetical protein